MNRTRVRRGADSWNQLLSVCAGTIAIPLLCRTNFLTHWAMLLVGGLRNTNPSQGWFNPASWVV